MVEDLRDVGGEKRVGVRSDYVDLDFRVRAEYLASELLSHTETGTTKFLDSPGIGNARIRTDA
jgi:hypothetical protein